MSAHRSTFVAGILWMLVIVCSAKPKEIPPIQEIQMTSGPAFLALYRDHCLNVTGDDQAFDELMEYFSIDLPKCVMAQVNVEQMVAEMHKLDVKDKQQFFEKICIQINASVPCLTAIKPKLKPCLEEENEKIMEQLVDTIPDALYMACDNSGALLQKFTEPVYRACAMELPPMIVECVREIPESIKRVPLSQYTEKQCDEIHSMRDCFSRRIKECGATGYMDFFTIFYRKLMALSPCK